MEERDLGLGRERLPRAELAGDLLVVVEHGDLDRHGREAYGRAARPRAPARSAPVHGELGLQRRDHELVGDRAHALVERAPGAAGAAARAEPGSRAGRGTRRGSRPAARRRAARSAPGCPRRSGVGTRVAELEVAERREHRQPQRRRPAATTGERALEPAHRRPPARPASSAGRAPGDRPVEPVGELGLARPWRRGGPAPATGRGRPRAASPASGAQRGVDLRALDARGAAAATCATSSRRRVAEPQPPQRVGPQAAQPRRSTGSPVGERAAAAVRAPATARLDRGQPGAPRRARRQPRAVAAADARRPARRPGRGATPRRPPRRRRLRAAPARPRGRGTRSLERRRAARRRPRPSAPRRRAPARRRGRRAASSAPRSARARGRPGRRAGRLVEHDEHRRRVAGQRPQVALVQRGVGVLLRVDDPHEQVDEPHEPVDLEPVRGLDRVEVGQVEQDEAVRRRRRRARAASGTSSQSSRRVVGAGRQTAAVAVDVVGRRTPARDELAARRAR